MDLTYCGFSNPDVLGDAVMVVQDETQKPIAMPLPLQIPYNLNLPQPSQLSNDNGVSEFTVPVNEFPSSNADGKPRCWEHGCIGREFSSKSNLVRHKKEKQGEAGKVICPLCGGIFTRSSARDTHLVKQSCNRIRRYSNGRVRPSKVALLNCLDLGEDIAGIQSEPPYY